MSCICFSLSLGILCSISITCSFAQTQAANYKIYTNFSCPSFESSSRVFVPTLKDCMTLADASPASDGAMFISSNFSCILITLNNNEIVVNLRSNGGWTTVVKDISETYRLVLKADSGQGGADTKYSMYNIITGSSSAVTTDWNSTVQSYDKTTSCKCSYRNQLLNYWNIGSVQIAQVRMRLWTSKLPIVHAIFNGTNTNSTNWLTAQKVLSIRPYGMQLFTNSAYCYGGVLVAPPTA